MHLDIYLDLETHGTTNGSGIWEVGAVFALDGEPVHSYSDIFCPQGPSDPETLEWLEARPDVWKRYQSALMLNYHETAALRKFKNFLLDFRGHHGLSINGDRDLETWHSWGSFDMPLLKTSYSNVGQFWHYGSECDLRSVAKFLGSKVRPDTSKHIAVKDAEALRIAHGRLLVDARNFTL